MPAVRPSGVVMKQRFPSQCLLILGVLATCGSAWPVFAQTAVSLDGIDDRVSLPSGTIPDSNLTIAMWVNPTALRDTSLVHWGVQSGCFPSSQELLITQGRLEMFTGCGEAFRFSGATPLSVGTWQHVALTMDPVGNAVLYFNGLQDAAGDARGGIPVSTGNDLIGATWSGGFIPPELHFPGAIDELQIYNRVLSPTEIGELFDDGKGRFGAVDGGGLLAGYHFDEGSDTSAADFSGNGRTASLINGVGWVPSSVALDAGIFATFSAQATLRLRPLAADDTLALWIAFRLSNDSDGIDPLTENVAILLGSFSATIPAGSFSSDPNGRLVFEGVIDGALIRAVLTPPRGHGARSRTFILRATVRGASLTGTVLPVSVGLTVGDDHSSTTLTNVKATAHSRP